jgi:hypothetical protein
MGQRRLILDLPLTVLTAAAILPAVGATQDPLRLPLTFLRNNPVTSIEVAGHEIKILVDTSGGTDLRGALWFETIWGGSKLATGQFLGAPR